MRAISGLSRLLVDFRGRAGWVVLGGLAAQMGLGCVYISSVLVRDMLDEFGWSRGDFMAAGSPRVIVVALMSPVIGALTYRFGARSVLAASIVLLGFVFALHAAIQNLWHVFGLSIGIGAMVAGVGDIAVGTVVAKWISRGRGLALGIVYSGSNLGGALASMLAAWILGFASWRETYLWVSAGAVVTLLPAVLLAIREPPAGYRPPSLAEADENDQAAESDATAVSDEQGMTLRDALRTRDFWILFVALFVFYVYYLGVNGNLILYLTDVGLSIQKAAAVFGTMVAFGIPAKVGIGLIADRWPARSALLLNFAVVTIASFLVMAIEYGDFVLLPAFAVLHGLATAAQNVVYPLVVASRFGVRHMAQIYGVLMLALLPGGALGPVFAGYMFEAFGSYTLAFQIFAGLNVVSLAALCTIRSGPKSRSTS